MFSSVAISVALLLVLGIILLNKLTPKKEVEVPPKLNSLQDKQEYIKSLQYRSPLDRPEWMYVLLGYFVLEKLVEIESLDQAYAWLEEQSPETLQAYAKEMMEDEAFLDTIIEDLPEELTPLSRDNVHGGADGAVYTDGTDGIDSSGDSGGDGGGE